MAMTMHVDIVSAEQQIFSGTAEMVFAPSVNGDVGVLPRHAPLLTQMRPGEVRIQTSEGEEVFYVSSGILEIQPHCVTILADTALRAKDIDEAAALEAKQLAEESMSDRKTGIDYTRAQTQLAEAMAQLKAIQKIRDKIGH
ncbi:MAG: F0F1 ATP synthase subunit epsilon [Gammaproteobacteria bacterium]|nr:F0F1 ATP synthase subunit epsilon [Gammaproteobacteria bacterium]MCF6229883.1 F0F1 ATP synthase subunit epsilon [Gammaproteobacteria bacterium]